MSLHFTIGCHNRYRTFRRRHGFQFSGIQILLADHVHRRTAVHNKFSLSSGLTVVAQVDTNSPTSEKNAVLSFSFLRGHLALAIPGYRHHPI